MNKIQEYQNKVDPERYAKEKEFIYENRNELKCCPYCNSNIQDRIISYFRELIADLRKVYGWCGASSRHEFKMSDIKQILSKNSYARFGDLVHFGGLVYKTEKGEYGLHMGRCKEFFNNERHAPMQIKRDQIKNKTIEANYTFSKDIIGISDLMTGGKFDEKTVIQVQENPNPRNLPPVK